MKRKILTVVATLLTGATLLCAEAGTTDKQNSTKASAAVVHSKIEMIIISQKGCISCKKIEKHMKNGKIKELLSKSFIVSRKDISESRSLPNNLEQPIGTPTIYFLGEDGEELIDTMVGGKSEENFIKTLHDAIKANQDRANS